MGWVSVTVPSHYLISKIKTKKIVKKKKKISFVINFISSSFHDAVLCIAAILPLLFSVFHCKFGGG